MLNHLTLLDIFLWITIIVLQAIILKLSWKSYKLLAWSMIYLLFESLVLFSYMFTSPQTYSKAYYILSIGESWTIALTSIEFSLLLLPKAKKIINYIGPAVVSAPIFCIGVIPWKIETINFITNILRVSQVAFVLSLSLLFFSFAFEDENVKERKLARSYSILLLLLVICAEVQLHFGIVGANFANGNWIRLLWPISWIVGLGLIANSLRELQEKYNGSSSEHVKTST